MPEVIVHESLPSSRPSAFQLGGRLAVALSLVLLGTAMSVWAYRWGQPDGPILYWGILPGAPLVALAALAMVPGVPLRVTIGAAVFGFIAVAIPYGALLYASSNYSGGGANIGLGLLLLATPLYLPIAMLAGGFAGGRVGLRED